MTLSTSLQNTQLDFETYRLITKSLFLFFSRFINGALWCSLNSLFGSAKTVNRNIQTVPIILKILSGQKLRENSLTLSS